MGLIKSKEIKKIEIRLIVLEMLKEYGIEPEDLHYLHEAIEYVKEKKSNIDKIIERVTSPDNRIKVLDEKTKKEIKDKADASTTPSDYIKQFTGEVEEFYPYGKPKTNNN